MSGCVRVVRGADAHRLLDDPGFVRDWQTLADLDPKNTWFQEPLFCRAWYAAYATVAEPVLALGHGDGCLTGVLPLTSLDGGAIGHAGTHQCGYQGWVAAGDRQQAFALAAVREVFRALSPVRWEWKSVSPGAPLEWLEDAVGTNGAGGLLRRSVRAPLLDVHDREFLQGRRSKSLKNYWNRLRKRGMRYERLLDRADAARVLQRLASWVDLRQGAGKEVLPFRQDPFKLDLHERLLERLDQVWMSVLWIDEAPIAAHLGPRIGDELALGIQGYDPAEGRLSPGIILMLEMAVDLAAGGGRTLDLTPGGDGFKERFASHHRQVTSFTLYRSRVRRLAVHAAGSARSQVRVAMARAGADPAQVRERLRRIAGGADKRRATALVCVEVDLGEAQGMGEEAPPAAPGHDATPVTDPQALECLLLEHAADNPAGSALLAVAMARWAAGWRAVATTGDDGSLAVLLWVQPSGRAERLPAGVAGYSEGATAPEGTLLVLADTPGGPATQASVAALRAAVAALGEVPARVWLVADLAAATGWQSATNPARALAS